MDYAKISQESKAAAGQAKRANKLIAHLSDECKRLEGELDALRPLVERAECEARIAAAGYTVRYDGDCGCNGNGYFRLKLGDEIGWAWCVNCDGDFWPAAADWADEQAAKRERWSEPVARMSSADLLGVL